MSRQFDAKEKTNLWVDEFDEFDWEQLFRQGPESQDYLNECLEPEYLSEDTDRSYMRCN